jgi:hypothetical protein
MRSLFLIIIISALSAYSALGTKKAMALEAAPCYEEPRGDLLPSRYLGPGDTTAVDSVFIDSSGVAWFRIVSGNKSFWTPGSKLRYISTGSQELLATRAQEDLDKFRRLKILRAHEDWPRRIKNAVRAGQVCLGMTAAQLAASWDKPQEQEKFFVLGIGACEYWRFIGADKKTCSVILQNDAVIGWSQGRKQ